MHAYVIGPPRGRLLLCPVPENKYGTERQSYSYGRRRHVASGTDQLLVHLLSALLGYPCGS